MEKQRILFIRPTMGEGGADRVTWQLLQHFDREKFTVALAVMRAEGPFMEGIPEDVAVYDLGAKSLYHMVVPLWRHLRQHRYDYLYSTSGGTNLVAGAVRLLPGKCPEIILSERNILFPPYRAPRKNQALKLLKTKLYGGAKWVTAVSEGIIDQLADDLAVPPARLRVVHNPLIDEALSTKQREPVTHRFYAPEYRVILAVGRFVRQKDYPTLIAAFDELSRLPGNEDLRLVILGDGPLRETIERDIRERQLGEKVDLAGYQRNPYNFMANCTVFVLASLHEGLPGVLVQALATGAPCVSTDCPTGPNELIEHGQSGFLVPVGDATAISQRVNELLKDDNLRHRFHTAGPRAVARYHTDRAIASYFDFL